MCMAAAMWYSMLAQALLQLLLLLVLLAVAACHT